MTDAILHLMQYASQGPQETCIVFALPGFFVWVFGKKVKPVTYAKQEKQPAKRRRKAVAKKAVVKKNFTTEKPKKAKVKTKKPERRSEPDPSPEFILQVDRYRAGRDGIKFNDNW